MDPIFRPACLSDVNEAVPFIYMSGGIPSGRNLFDIFLGLDQRGVLDLLGKLFTAKTSCWLHYSVFYVVEIEKAIVAVSCAYLEAEHGIHTMVQALIECGWREKDFHHFKRVGGILNRVRTGEDTNWKLEFVAAHPQYRRKGFIQLLLSILLRKGKNRGLHRAQIAFFTDNVSARRTYEKVGFHSEKTLKDAEFTKLFHTKGVTTLFQEL